MLERRHTLDRRIFNLLNAEGRCTDRAIWNKAQFCLNNTLNRGGFSAYQIVFGPDPADWYRLDFRQNASASSQFAHQLKLRVVAPEAMLRGMANGRLRRPPAPNPTFQNPGIEVGDSVICYEENSRKSALERGGPAAILGVDATGVKVKFQSQAPRVARNFVRKRRRPTGVGDARGLDADHCPCTALEEDAADLHLCDKEIQVNPNTIAGGESHGDDPPLPPHRRRSPWMPGNGPSHLPPCPKPRRTLNPHLLRRTQTCVRPMNNCPTTTPPTAPSPGPGRNGSVGRTARTRDP